jgi:hypothetical protein
MIEIGLFIMTVAPMLWLRIVGYVVYQIASVIKIINAISKVTPEEAGNVKDGNAGVFYASITSIICIVFEIMIITMPSLLGRAIILVIYRILNPLLYRQSVNIAME